MSEACYTVYNKLIHSLKAKQPNTAQKGFKFKNDTQGMLSLQTTSNYLL